MKSIVYKISVLMLLGIFLGMMPKESKAGSLEAAMQDQLNLMVNTTDPSYVETARKGVFSGGSMVVRSRIMNPQWANFQMPSASAGCGGWNIFGGSFSFISSEQIVAMLRSIASNAVGLAFKAALELISPQLQKILSELEAGMQAMNNGAMNSCQIASKLTDALKGDGDFHAKDLISANAMEHFGAATDALGAWMRGDAKKDTTPSNAADTEMDEADTEQKAVIEAIIEGNLTWNVLNKSDATNWTIVGGGGTIKEEMMTLVGTQIICKPGKDFCPADTQETPSDDTLMISMKEGGGIDFKTFIDGTSTGQTVKILRCGTGSVNQEKCLNPNATDTTMTGFKPFVKNIICGDTGPTCASSTGGLISRYKAGIKTGAVPTAADLAMIAALDSAGVWTGIKNISISNETAGRNFADVVMPVFAAEVGYNVIVDTLKSMNAAAASVNQGRDLKTQEQVRKAFATVNADYKAYVTENQVKSGVIGYYKDVLSTSNSNKAYYLPTNQ